MGHNERGESIRLPALGEISGDWGGGDDLAREAIRLVARAHDGRGGPTALTDLVLAALGAETVDDMIRKLYLREIGMDMLRTVPPLVFRAASAGDPVACRLVERSGEEIAVTAAALLRRLDLVETPADVVLAGSVFRGEGPLLLDTVRRLLRERAPQARVVLPNVEPAVGAFFCALDLLGISVDTRVRDRARTTYGALIESSAVGVRP
jgi:N-acetylglucosamine kinase-like BadF-type ATPase